VLATTAAASGLYVLPRLLSATHVGAAAVLYRCRALPPARAAGVYLIQFACDCSDYCHVRPLAASLVLLGENIRTCVIVVHTTRTRTFTHNRCAWCIAVDWH